MKLKSVIEELMLFSCYGGDNESSEIIRYSTIWPSNQQEHKLTFNKRSLRSAINYLLGNCYLTIGSIGVCAFAN